jgi:hypothetical protein
VITLTFSLCPFYAALLITVLSYFSPPYWDRSLHHSYASGETEILYPTAWPFPTLMTGVIPFGFDAVPYGASFAKTIELLGWIGLHAAKTFGFFWFCSVKIAHHRLEFLISIPCCNVNSAGPAIQPAGCHQILISHFFFGPSFCTHMSSMHPLNV